MAYGAVAGLSDPLEDYQNYWLKFYEQGTTTPLAMATDSSGAVTLAKAEVSAGGTVPAGFIKTVGDVIFIPFINAAYDAFLFPTAAEADANDTSNAVKIADDITAPATQIALDNTKFPAVADLIANTIGYPVGTTAETASFFAPSAGDTAKGGAQWTIVATGGTPTVGPVTVLGSNGQLVDAAGNVWGLNCNPTVEIFGGYLDGTNDDYQAAQNSIDYAFANARIYGQGYASYGRGVLRTSQTIVMRRGVTFSGLTSYDSILYYTGTGDAIDIPPQAPRSTIQQMHVTSLDPGTPNWAASNNVGFGTGQNGIHNRGVQTKIIDVKFSYFNDVTSWGFGFKSSDTSFSTLIDRCFFLYNWGDMCFQDTQTDVVIRDTQCQWTTKVQCSIGYDWQAASGVEDLPAHKTTFVGDNFRFEGKNAFERVGSNGSSPAVGDCYSMYLVTGSVFDISGVYCEDYAAEAGHTAYGIYANSLAADGSTLLQININKNNIVTNFAGNNKSVSIQNAWYGGGSGNHFGPGNNQVETLANARWFTFETNFFTGAPSSPYSLLGTGNKAYNPVLAIWESSPSYTETLSYAQRLSARTINTELTLDPDNAAPDVSGGNQFRTANTGLTIYNNFGGTDGQTIKIIIADGTTAFDFTGTALRGNSGVDWSPNSGDHVTCTRSGSVWYCDVSNNTA